MYLSKIKIQKHPILKDIELSFVNPKTNKPYSIVAFVGENGCGKTTLLNELFNYENSKYIIDKEKEHPFSMAQYSSLFLRQSSLARNAMKEIGKLIDGRDRYSANSQSNVVQGLKTTNPIEDKEQGLKILEILDDVEIYKLFKEGVIGDVSCGGEISKLISGQNDGYDISKYSSGQQEMLLKLKDLKELYANTDSVLLDEPETSLHPRWQKEIVNLISLLITDSNGDKPQIFLATHSEKVLESLIIRDDVLIVRLFKEKGNIETETINQMALRLPSPTFAELDYIVFNIPSLDYHDELFSWFADKYELDNVWEIDKAIRESEEYNSKEYKKVWIAETKKGITTYKTLPVYIRNYFHHPKKDKAPSEEELVKSIKLMRKLVNTSKD